MRTFIPVILIALGACQPANVYERPVPNGDDAKAMNEIRDGLKPEDRQAWAQIVMRKANPIAEGVTSKTVGEAIAGMKAKAACMDAHNVANIDPALDREKYNAEVMAYNECLKLPV